MYPNGAEMTREDVGREAREAARAYYAATAAGLSARAAVQHASARMWTAAEERRAERSASAYRALRASGVPAQVAFRAVLRETAR